MTESQCDSHDGHGEIVDVNVLWRRESAAMQPPPLRLIKLDENERLLIPFTSSILRMGLHYLNSQALQAYLQCLGSDCLSCRLGRKVDVRDLLPIYDVVDRLVGVLPISPDLQPNALRPQLQPILEQLAAGKPPCLTVIRRLNPREFAVGTLPLPEDADDGSAIINVFRSRLEAGNVDLASAYQRLDNAALAGIPEIAIAMKARGITA